MRILLIFFLSLCIIAAAEEEIEVSKGFRNGAISILGDVAPAPDEDFIETEKETSAAEIPAETIETPNDGENIIDSELKSSAPLPTDEEVVSKDPEFKNADSPITIQVGNDEPIASEAEGALRAAAPSVTVGIDNGFIEFDEFPGRPHSTGGSPSIVVNVMEGSHGAGQNSAEVSHSRPRPPNAWDAWNFPSVENFPGVGFPGKGQHNTHEPSGGHGNAWDSWKFPNAGNFPGVGFPGAIEHTSAERLPDHEKNPTHVDIPGLPSLGQLFNGTFPHGGGHDNNGSFPGLSQLFEPKRPIVVEVNESGEKHLERHQSSNQKFLGLCPPVRLICPSNSSIPSMPCLNDFNCPTIEKCCYDICLTKSVCKLPILNTGSSSPILAG